jgi:murein DD-endopeptidase MepM/ murein hydrolase activator NlpD
VLDGPAKVTSTFGDRVDPLDGSHKFHGGIDLAAPEGTPILAARDGVVISAGPRGDYGNAVEVRHDDGTTTLYGHASRVDVTPGQHVRQGDPIAAVGSTGRSIGNHLYFEVCQHGQRVDPRSALQIYGRRAEAPSGSTTPLGAKP